MFLKFTATKTWKVYRSSKYHFRDGEVKEVSDGIGKRMLKDFPANFSIVEPQEPPSNFAEPKSEPAGETVADGAQNFGSPGSELAGRRGGKRK